MTSSPPHTSELRGGGVVGRAASCFSPPFLLLLFLPLLFCLSCTSAVKPIRGLGGGRAPPNHHSREELLHLPRAERELRAEGGDREEPSLRLGLRVRVCVCSTAADTAAAAADFSLSRRCSRLFGPLLPG